MTTLLPGSELNAIVAERVMGWRLERTGGTDKYRDAMRWVDTSGQIVYVAEWHWKPSTKLVDAWVVLNHMMDKGGAFGVWLAQTHESLTLCQFQIGETMYEGEGVSFPHAICNAALAALSPADDGGAR